MIDLAYAQLEPEAVTGKWGSELATQLSIAISLKRIADTFDGTAAGLNVHETIFGQHKMHR